MSNRELDLPKFEGPNPTLHAVLGPSKGWHPDEPLLQRDSWNDHKTTHTHSYVVTGGAHYAGAKNLSDFSVQHMLDWRDKAHLQTFGNTSHLKFPDGTAEQKKKRMIGNMVPPAFSKVLGLAASELIKTEIAERHLGESILRAAIAELKEKEIPINPLTGKEYSDPHKEFATPPWQTSRRWSPPRGNEVLRCLPGRSEVNTGVG